MRLMKNDIKKKILLLAIAILLLLLSGCSKEEKNKKDTDVSSVSQQTVNEQTEPKENKLPQKADENEPIEREIPTLEVSKYTDHEGVVFLLAYTELIKAQRYSDAAKYFTADMVQEIREYGYDNAEGYFKDTFTDTAKGDIQLVLYEVNTDYIISGITRTDGITPFSANLTANKWVLNFSPLN